MDFVNKKRIFFLNFIIVLIIFGVDRISKIYVVKKFKENLNNTLYESKFLNIHLIWNEGIAFGLMSLNQGKLYNFLTLIIIIVILLILYFIYNL